MSRVSCEGSVPRRSAARRDRVALALVFAAACVVGAEDASAQQTAMESWVPIDPEFTLYVRVPQGRIVVALSQDLAQGHVTQMRELARAGYFDGLQFYRVIEGRLAQGGDFTRSKPSPESLQAEFDEPWSDRLAFVPLNEVDQFGEQAGFINGFPVRRSIEDDRVWMAHCSAVMGLGRRNDPNSATAHFWIALHSNRPNERNHTIFGRVVWGMEHASMMTRTGDVLGDESRWTPIISVKVAADVPPDERTALEMLDTNSEEFQSRLAERRNPTEPPAADWFVHRPRNFGVCEAQVPVRLTQTTGERDD